MNERQSPHDLFIIYYLFIYLLFIYLFIYYLFIYSFIIYLFIYSFIIYLFIHLLMKSAFLLSKGLLCLYDKQNNTQLLVDMEFLFSCSTRHLTRSLRHS